MNLLESLRLKGEVLFLLMAFLATCLSVIANTGEPDYSQCHHDFNEGCPVHDSWSWKCAQRLKNCTDPNHRYHCIRNTKDKIRHVCVPVMKCKEGTQPVYDEQKLAISCEPCPQEYFQVDSVWSDEALMCEKRHTCDIQSNKIECPVGLEMKKTQDVLCRCDARNNFVPLNNKNSKVCFPWYFSCWQLPCPGNGTERLLNYTCVPKCQEGHERNERDICMPIAENREGNTTTTGSLPPNTTVTTTSSTSSTPGVQVSVADYTVLYIVLATSLAIVAIAFIVTIVCCIRARKTASLRKGNSQELEPLQNHQRINATPSPVQASSRTEQTVNNINYYNITLNSKNTQVGDGNKIISGQVDDANDNTDDDLPDNASNSNTANSDLSENEGNIARHRDTSLDMPPSGDCDLNNVAHDPEENKSPQDSEETFRKIQY